MLGEHSRYRPTISRQTGFDHRGKQQAFFFAVVACVSKFPQKAQKLPDIR